MTTETNNDDHFSKQLFEELRRLKGECGSNKNVQADVLIGACILNGLDTYRRIVGALTELEFNWEHVSIRLRKGNGKDPHRHLWQLGLDRRFTLHSETLHAAGEAGAAKQAALPRL